MALRKGGTFMDWGRAKNYIIAFLVGLNLFLFVCNVWFNKRYVVTDTQIDSIAAILKQKNIKLDSEIPISYKPMAQISFNECVYDVITLQEIFFGPGADVKRTSDFQKTVLSYDNQTITVFNDIVEYQKTGLDFNGNFNTEDIIKICEEYINKISDFYFDFKFYEIKVERDFCYAEYVQEYKGFQIFNNYVKIKVSKNGTINIRLRYFPIKNMYGESVDICSADEALFIFSDRAKEICGLDFLTVKKIDKGYYFDEFDKGGNIISVPYYRIEVSEREEPFFVNAYNRCLSE